jgi:polyphenol oxidase
VDEDDASHLGGLCAELTGTSKVDYLSGPVFWLQQVHGSAVRVVTKAREPSGCAGGGDALVSSASSACLVVMTADCASVALASDGGVFGAVHAGWRGLMDGVVEAAVAAMRAAGADVVSAALGPCIHAECYEFSPHHLDLVAARFGDGVRSETSTGRPSLDLPAVVAMSLRASDVRMVGGVDACTACSDEVRYFSHRARADTGRQAMVVWSTSQGAA